MAGEAPQLSFIQGEVSPEYFFRSDLTSFNASLAKAVNLELSPLGGVHNRIGSKARLSPVGEGVEWGRMEVNSGDPFIINGVDPIRTSSSGYAACVFKHYITGDKWELEVVAVDGAVNIYLKQPDKFSGRTLLVRDDQVEGPIAQTGYPGVKYYDFRDDIGTGIKGLRFIVHNDTVIFSKNIPMRIKNTTLEIPALGIPSDVPNYLLPDPNNPTEYVYTETQLVLRMLADGQVRLETNFNMQQVSELTYTWEAKATSQTKYTGAATYALIVEDDKGVDSHVSLPNSISGVDIDLNGGAKITNAIPFPITGNTSISLSGDVEKVRNRFGGREYIKAKLYRTSGKLSSYAGLFKLVSQQPMVLRNVGQTEFLEFSDSGQEEAAYTACSDTRALYRQPSLMTLCSAGGWYSYAVGGLKTVVDTAIFQQRAFYAINKGPWWGTSVYNNSIVASRIGSPGQTIMPQITNEAEAFTFNVPEEAGGYLTHLASLSRLVAFTNTTTFIIQGDDAGIIRPTAINPYKLLSFGSKEGVPPAVSGETCIFAASTGGVGFVTVDANGDAIGGYASALASHLFEDVEVISIVPMPDAKTFPRWAIKTSEGKVIICYRVGDTFSFFPMELGSAVGDKVLPLVWILNPDIYASGTTFINPVVFRNKYSDYICWEEAVQRPQIGTKILDYSEHLDLKTTVGSRNTYVTYGEAKYRGWLFDPAHYIAGAESFVAKIQYVDPLEGFFSPLTPSTGPLPMNATPEITTAGVWYAIERIKAGVRVVSIFGLVEDDYVPGGYTLMPFALDEDLVDDAPDIHFNIGAPGIRENIIQSGGVVGYVISRRDVTDSAIGSLTKGWLVDPTGLWEANTDVLVNLGEGVGVTELPLTLKPVTQRLSSSEIKMCFSWYENGVLNRAFADLREGTVSGYVLSFTEEVPEILRKQEPNIYFYPGGKVNVEDFLREGSVVAELGFNTIRVGLADYSVYADAGVPSPGRDQSPEYLALFSAVEARGYKLDYDTFPGELNIPVVVEIDGVIYGNYKDPNYLGPEEVLKVTKDTVLPGKGFIFEIDLPSFATYASVGIPAVAEMETLPVASIQQDITDAKKNIDYASVILYRTKGLRIGEAGQPDDQLEVMDFTTDDSVDVPVPYTGPKGYNFASTWNLEGRIRVSGLDLQPFSISGIIPKGNVGSF